MRIKASGRWALIVTAGFWICTSGPLHAQLWPDKPPAQAEASTEQPVALGKPIALNKYIRHRSRHSRRHASSHSRRHRIARKETKSARHDEARNDDSRSDESRAKDSKLQESQNLKQQDSRLVEANASKPGQAMKGDGSFTILSSSVANARAQLLSATRTGGQTAIAPPAAQSTPAATSPDASSSSRAPASLADGSSPPQAAGDASIVAADELNEVDRAVSANNRSAPTVALASVSAAPGPTAAPAAVASADDSAWAHTSMLGKVFIAFGGLLMLASAARMLIT